MVEIGSTNKSFYYFVRDDRGVYQLRLQLKDKVKHELLQAAAMEALKAFPMMRLRPYISRDGALFFEENDSIPLIQKYEDEVIGLGTEKSNGYLFRIMYEDQSIILSAFHGLTDARGGLALLISTMYYYFRLQGIEVSDENVYTVENTREDKTIMDLLEQSCKEELTEPVKSPLKAPPSASFPIVKEASHSWLMKWDNDQLVTKAKELGGSILTLFTVILSWAYYRLHPEEERALVYEVPVDMRGKLNSRSQSNFTINISLVFEKSNLSLQVEEQVQVMYRQLKEKTQTQSLISEKTASNAYTEKLLTMPILSLREMAKQEDGKNAKPSSKLLLLTNVGRLVLPMGMQEQVVNMEMHSKNMGLVPMYALYSLGREGRLLIVQESVDTSYHGEIQKVLSELGINTSMECERDYSYDYVEPLLFERRE